MAAYPTPTLSFSKPMVIPSRGQRLENRRPRYAGLPPAVAALLAGTTIPRPARKSTRRRKPEGPYYSPPTPPNATPFDCADPVEGEDDGTMVVEDQISSKSTLGVLLSPPEDDDDYDSIPMARSNSDDLSVHSSSAESIPALDTDNESTFSLSSSWSHPAPSRRRSSVDARARIVASPPVECDCDHPLMATPEEDVATAAAVATGPALELLPEATLRRVTRCLNLVSNLTASLRVLKSAARSFSNLTTAIHQSEDYLTRSILSISPQYTDERRPSPSEDEPTPALRRYLNPWSSSHDESPCTGAVQMQTYNESGRSKPGRIRDESESCACGPMVRQREVRENPDFLRVIVLEMNMRRGGKLSDTAQGRARYMLPPRKACTIKALGDPARWTPWVVIGGE